MEAKNRRYTMIGIFIVITIIGFFFSPLGDKVDAAVSQIFHFDENGLFETLMTKVLFSGIWDYIEVFALMTAGAIVEGVDDFLGFLPAPFIIAAFIGAQYLIDYIYEEIKDESDVLGNMIDAFLLENIVGFFFSIVVSIILNIGTKVAIGIQNTNEGLAAIVGIVAFLGVMFGMLLCAVLMLFYGLCACLPVLLGAFVANIPIIGGVLSLIVIVILEAIFLLYLWREYISNWAFKASLWVAKLPFLMFKIFLPFR